MDRRSRTIALLLSVLALGIGIRIGLGWVNPPSNTYDDHLTPVALYANSIERPTPDACWQCYQPPVYYTLAAVVLRGSDELAGSDWFSWKAVQLMSAAASAVTLILTFLILRLLFPKEELAQFAGLCLAALLPRDIYTAASLSNDAFLQLFVTGAVLAFVWGERASRGSERGYAAAGVAAFAVLACWTKQSGLVLLGLVGIVWMWLVTHRWKTASRWPILAVACLTLFALIDEAWRIQETGIVLASNQHFEPRAALEGQPPGQLSWSTFGTFLPGALMSHPTLSPRTVDSLWTQLFARTWFDYEPRFLPPGSHTLWLARALYIVGLITSLIAAYGVLTLVKQAPRLGLPILSLPLGFLGATILQTIRFPYFSSMKAIFLIPSMSVFALTFAAGVAATPARTPVRRAAVGFVVLLVLVGTMHAVMAMGLNAHALGTPTSPQWLIPDIQFTK